LTRIRARCRLPAVSYSLERLACRFNSYDYCCNGGLLGREMRAKMTPNVLARSPKTHSNRTIKRVLPGRNRALLLQQQTTASIGARMCAAAILPAGLTQTNLGHAAFYRIRRPLWRDALAPPVGAGCDLIIGCCPHQVSHRSTVRRVSAGERKKRESVSRARGVSDGPTHIHTDEETLVTSWA
jgi:hypothetical protein